jgi:adenylate cyclase
MATQTSLTAIARANAEHHEREVLAARALENERRVAIVRLLVLVLSGISQGVVRALTSDHADEGGDPFHLVVVGSYLAFCVSTLVAVHRAKPSTVLAQIMPILMTTVDVAFVVAMEWNDLHTREGVELDQTSVMLALIISYSILRYGLSSLVYSTVLAIAAYTTSLVWSGGFDWPTWTFVTFVYLALAALLWATRSAVRKAFVELKRRDGLSRFVPTKVVDEILAGREETLLPTRREVTVLFSDIRGFTTFSEAREPEEVLRFLDDYFGRMTQIVRGHDGSVNKFIGDGLLAIWGAPTPRDDHAVAATKAALDMQKVMVEINAARESKGEAPLRIGVGLHSGFVAAGMLGSAEQAEYTVIGDAVNLASRIEGLTKEHEGVLVSEATWEKISHRFAGARVGEFQVKGRRAPVVVYSVTGALRAEERPATG